MRHPEHFTLANKEDWDPMRDEPLTQHVLAGHPSKESRIQEMLESATGWTPVASPRGPGGDMEQPDDGTTTEALKKTTPIHTNLQVGH